MNQGLSQQSLPCEVLSNMHQQLNQIPDLKQKQRKSRGTVRCGNLLGLVDELKTKVKSKVKTMSGKKEKTKLTVTIFGPKKNGRFISKKKEVFQHDHVQQKVNVNYLRF
jgi:hypothetical protein